MLEYNLKCVKDKINNACLKVGRDPDEVTLVAVSKMKPLSDIEELIKAGHYVYGENYVQELCEKYENVSQNVEWHMIGHLQTNKVKYIIDKVSLIHSVDSFHLAKQIEKEAKKHNITAEILLQVNIAREGTKFGLCEDQVLLMAENISSLEHVHVNGLMTSAPYVLDPEDNREYFRRLHKLFIDIGKKNMNNIDMNILSMGMTNDYEIAIEEGATMVRVGTGIFGERDYKN